MLIYTKLCAVIRPKKLKRSNNLFKQQFLMHLTTKFCAKLVI
jgi:hypothetical protein